MADAPRLGSSTLLSEGDGFRISRHTLQPGESTGVHTHEYDYVVVPLTDGTVTVISGSDSAEFSMAKRAPYTRSAGVTHNLLNHTERVVDFIEVEHLV